METKYAIGVNSGTDAIKLSLKAMNIAPFLSLVLPLIFVDYNDTFCIDTNLMEAKITKKTEIILWIYLLQELLVLLEDSF